MKITVEVGSYSKSKKERPSEVEIYFDNDGLEYLIEVT